MNADIFWILVPSLLIGLLAWIVAATRNVRIATLQTQLQRALIDKIGSQEDLRAYCESHAIDRLLQGGVRPSEMALESIRTGIVLTVAGVVIIIWASVDSRVPFGIGLVAASLGVGCLAAGAATRHLARRWGLLDRDPEGRENLNARR